MAQDVVVRVSKIPQIETPLLTPSRFFLDPYEPAFSSRGRCIFLAITSGLGLPLGTHNMVSCSPQTTRLPSKRRPETPGSPLSQCWAQREGRPPGSQNPGQKGRRPVYLYQTMSPLHLSSEEFLGSQLCRVSLMAPPWR